MAHSSTILPNITGATRLESAPIAYAITPTGMTIVPYEIDGCKWCPNSATHKAWCGYWTRGYDSSIIADERAPTTEDMVGWQYLLSSYYYYAEGIATRDYIYNAGDGNNFVSRVGEFTVNSAINNTITFATGGVDPRNMAIGYYRYPNPDWASDPENEPYYKIQTVYGSLQIGDVGTVGVNSVANTRGDALRIKAINCSNVDSGGTFTVTTEQSYGSAISAVFYDSPVVSFWRYQFDPEDWIEPVINDSIKCTPETFSMEEADWTDPLVSHLSGTALISLTLIAYPRLAFTDSYGNSWRETFSVVKYASGVATDISSLIVPDRISISHTAGNTFATYVHFGPLLPDGTSGTNLLLGADSVTVNFLEKDVAGTIFYEAPRCSHCKTVYSGSSTYTGFPAVKSYGGLTEYCGARNSSNNPSGEPTFQVSCAKLGTCDRFTQYTPQFFTDDVINQLWGTEGCIRIRQKVVGYSGFNNYTIERVGSPGLGTIFGHWMGLEAPGSWRPNIEYIGDGRHGSWESTEDYEFYNGMQWRNPGPDHYDYDSLTQSDILTSFDAYILGVLPSEIATWNTQESVWDDSVNESSTTDPYYNFRAHYFGRHNGYTIEYGTPSGGFASAQNQRNGWYEHFWLAQIIDKVNGSQNRDQTLTIGNYDAVGAETTPAAAVYSAKMDLRLPTHAGFPTDEDTTKLSGYARSVSLDGSLYKVECHLGYQTAGTKTSPWNWEDTITSWYAGGNIVKAPDYLEVFNAYTERSFGHPWDLAIPGDVIRFPDHPTYPNVKFWIKQVEPHAGTVPSTGAIPAEQTEYYNIKTSGVYITNKEIDPTSSAEVVDYVVDHAVTGTKLKRVAMTDGANGYRKYWIQSIYLDSHWTESNGTDTIAKEDFVDMGPPPGFHTGSLAWSERLEAGEYYVTGYFDYNTGLNSVGLAFSFEDTATIAEIDVYYTDLSYQLNRTVPYCIVNISDDLYDSLDNIVDGNSVGPNGEKLEMTLDEHEGGAYENDLVALTRTTESNQKLTPWWIASSSDKTDRNKFYLYDGGVGNKFVRFHNDFFNRLARATVPATSPITSPESYWNTKVQMHSDTFPPDYGRYVSGSFLGFALKSDLLHIVNEAGIMISMSGDLDDALFEVTSDGILHPDTPVMVYIDEYANGTPTWTFVDSSNYTVLYANGQIYFKKAFWNTWVGAPSAPTRCIKVVGYPADRSARPRARAINDINRAILQADIIECRPVGGYISSQLSATWVAGPQDWICSGSQWLGQNHTLGLQKTLIASKWSSGDEDELILETPSPIITSAIGCPSGSGNLKPVGSELIEDEGLWNDSPVTPPKTFYIGVQPNPADQEYGFALGFEFVWKAQSHPFNLLEVYRLPNDCEIIKAYADIKLTSPELTTRSFTYPASSVTVTTVTSNVPVALSAIGSDVDGNIWPIGYGGSATVNDGTWHTIEITSLVKSIYAQRGDPLYNIGVAASPVGYSIVDLATFDKANSIAMRNAFCQWELGDASHFSSPTTDPYWAFTSWEAKMLGADGFDIQNVRVQYSLPNGVLDSVALPYGNLPIMTTIT